MTAIDQSQATIVSKDIIILVSIHQCYSMLFLHIALFCQIVLYHHLLLFYHIHSFQITCIPRVTSNYILWTTKVRYNRFSIKTSVHITKADVSSQLHYFPNHFISKITNYTNNNRTMRHVHTACTVNIEQTLSQSILYT